MAGDKEIQRIVETGIDIITAGFPCQDISYAGKGAGLEGARSGLWLDALDTICMVGPRFALLENVPALLNRGMGEVLGGLAEGGYDAQWDCISAAAVGAPHRRWRTFVIAHSQGEQIFQLPETFIFANSAGSRQQRSRQLESSMHFAKSAFGEASGLVDAVRKGALPYVCRRHDGSSRGVDRIRALGNAVVPQVAEYVGERLIEWLDSGG